MSAIAVPGKEDTPLTDFDPEKKLTVENTRLLAGVVPQVATIRLIRPAADETTTYWVEIDDPEVRRTFSFQPGQISLIGMFGVGEIPISISSDPAEPQLLGHTVRACGRVTNAMLGLKEGDQVTIRAPFGRPWPVPHARGGDLLIVAGGLGMAPVRPAIYTAMRNRGSFRRVIVLVGARNPGQILYPAQMEDWLAPEHVGAIELTMTVDVPDDDWKHDVGLVTSLFPKADIDPRMTTVFTCGPEIMMRFAIRDLLAMGVPRKRIWLSMERNMHCAVKFCGHCQIGPYFVCEDGPVFNFRELEDLMEVEEL
jgi:NAD(P)H-flavin reductase